MDIRVSKKDFPQYSEEEQCSLIARYQQGDSEAAGQLIESQQKWIYAIINQQKMPSWVDYEEVFADVMVDVLKGLKLYDPSKSSVQTYLHMVVSCAAVRSVKFYTSKCTLPLKDIPVVSPERCEVVDVIHAVMAARPSDELNEAGKQVLTRILQGYDVEEISGHMGWPMDETERVIVVMREFIAYCLAKAGKSAEPWIPDSEILGMANRYAKRLEGWL